MRIDWTVDDWKRVIFSDGTMIGRVGSFGRKYYYNDQEHKRRLPHQVRLMQQGGGDKIMVWECIIFFGPGNLGRINGVLNSEYHLTVLDGYVINSLEWYGMDPAKSIVQQDKSRVYTANTVQQWFGDQVFAVLDWPANSLDHNVIKQV